MKHFGITGVLGEQIPDKHLDTRQEHEGMWFAGKFIWEGAGLANTGFLYDHFGASQILVTNMDQSFLAFKKAYIETEGNILCTLNKRDTGLWVGEYRICGTTGPVQAVITELPADLAHFSAAGD